MFAGFSKPIRFSRPSLLCATAIAAVLAGCSGDSSRFATSAFTDPMTTGSITPRVGIGEGAGISNAPQQATYAAPQPNYQTQPDYQTQQTYQPQATYQPQPNYQQTATYNQPEGQVVYRPQPVSPGKPLQEPMVAPRPEPVHRTQTASLQQTVAAPAPVAEYTAPAPSTEPLAPGSCVRIETGDTAYGIARRAGISVGTLLSANGISDPSDLRVGQILVIPTSSPALRKTAAKEEEVYTPPTTLPKRRMVRTKSITISDEPAPAAAAPQGRGTKVHTVASGDTLYGIARTYGVSSSRIVAANAIDDAGRLKIGQKLVIPAEGEAVAPRPVQTASRTPDNQVVADAPKPYVPPQQPTAPARTPVKSASTPDTPTKPEAASMRLRWPAQGRIISSFGRKSNGAHNDGINIALPEGAPIHAAEGGVVAYAGNELKGFGNLILIRHANDLVTAYAHASSIDVKRGEKITRGQMIGRAGKTGTVSSPQLHFEVRKGSKPVNPMTYLQS